MKDDVFLALAIATVFNGLTVAAAWLDQPRLGFVTIAISILLIIWSLARTAAAAFSKEPRR